MRRNRRFSPYALRDARQMAGWTRARLGEQVGVSTATVKAWETGARAPKASTQLRVARALGVGFEDLEQPGPADAEDLRRLRETQGWTREEAAELLGIDTSVLARVEAGAELPPDPRRMARVYGLTAGELAQVWRRGGEVG